MSFRDITGMTRGDEKMKTPPKQPRPPTRKEPIPEDLFDLCLRKGLIEKTPYGYYFTSEFFETLAMYEGE